MYHIAAILFGQYGWGIKAKNYILLFDKNDNMTTGGIVTFIDYNSLNLPQQIVLSGGRSIENTYAADGRKLFASATENNQPVSDGTRYYNGNLVFDINGELEYILIPEGRILNNNGAFEYEYHLKDHLGSVRVAFVPTVNGKEVVQENAYYPFGATIADLSYAAPLNNNRYGYTGQEQLNDFDLNWYDYIARNYNPLIGRFNSIDPLAEKYYSISPYAYCNNNPVKYVDPDGRDGIVAIKGNQITISANVFLYGAGATKAVAAQMQSDINSKWGGKYSSTTSDGKNSFDVTVGVNININLYGGKEKSEPFIIPESWNPFNRDNFIEIDAGSKRSYVKGGDEGKWRSQGRNGMTLAQDDPAPHEVGHLLGLGDRYSDKKGAHKGWENNIMSSGTGNVEQRNIDGILKDAMKEYEKWIQNPENIGKDFKYEIDSNRPRN